MLGLAGAFGIAGTATAAAGGADVALPYYSMYVHLLPEIDRLEGRARIRLVPLRPGLAAARLWLDPGYRVAAVRLDGRLVAFQRRGAQLTVALPRGYAAGRKMVLSLAWDGHPGSGVRLDHTGAWLDGQGGWYPHAMPMGSSAPPPTASLHVTVPPGWSALAPGRARGVEGEAARPTWTWEIERPEPWGVAAGPLRPWSLLAARARLNVYARTPADYARIAARLRLAAAASPAVALPRTYVQLPAGAPAFRAEGWWAAADLPLPAMVAASPLAPPLPTPGPPDPTPSGSTAPATPPSGAPAGPREGSPAPTPTPAPPSAATPLPAATPPALTPRAGGGTRYRFREVRVTPRLAGRQLGPAGSGELPLPGPTPAAFLVTGTLIREAPDVPQFPTTPLRLTLICVVGQQELRLSSHSREVGFGFVTHSRPLRVLLGAPGLATATPTLRRGGAAPDAVLVYGTGGGEADANHAAALAYQTALRAERGGSPPPVVSDRELGEADRARTLILFGRPSTNRVAAEVADQLPVHFYGGSIWWQGRTFRRADVGAVMAIPNPRAPERDLLLFAGLTPAVTRRAVAFRRLDESFCIFDQRGAIARGLAPSTFPDLEFPLY